MKGTVLQRGSVWYYKFRLPERDPSTGRYPWITKGGFDTEREAWKACREAMRDADRGRVVKPSTRTVAQFLTEWLAAVEPALDATTWRSWSDYARTYVIPHIGAELLQRLDEPQLLRLYTKLLTEGRLKRDNDSVMYAYWSHGNAAGDPPTPRQLSEACDTTIHAARTAVRRYRVGIVPKPVPPGLAPKTVRNVHAFLHRALVDAVAWKYITDNPASNVKPPRRPRTRRTVWKPEEIRTFLASIRDDRFAALFLLELTTGIRRGQVCGLKWCDVDLDAGQRRRNLLGAGQVQSATFQENRTSVAGAGTLYRAAVESSAKTIWLLADPSREVRRARCLGYIERERSYPEENS